jgi:hypothetical protein
MVDRVEFPHESRSTDPKEKVYYSDLRVCQSGAGYYIGRMCWVEDEHGGYPDAGSRESDYYDTQEDAENAIKSLSFDRQSDDVDFLYDRLLEIPRPKAN